MISLHRGQGGSNGTTQGIAELEKGGTLRGKGKQHAKRGGKRVTRDTLAYN